MRLFLAAALLCLICSVSLVHAEEPLQPKPLSNRITGFFKNWFGRRPPSTPGANPGVPDVADPLTKEDFESSLPRQPTDMAINDSIAQKILEESKPLLADSPFIPAPAESRRESNVITADRVASSSSHDASINGSSAGDREAAGKSLEDDSPIPIAEALRIVNSANLSDCVARVICELSCNANAYGAQGKAVFRNLIKLQFDQNVKSEDAKFFRQAALKGRQIVQGKRDCKECFTVYPSCRSSSSDLIAVSSMFHL